MSFAFHWQVQNWKGRFGGTYYPPAIESAAAFLSNYSANGKVAIWRSTSPTHFPGGAYDKDNLKNTCEPYVPACDNDEQAHNSVIRRMLDRIARGSKPLQWALNQSTVHLKFPMVDDNTLAAWEYVYSHLETSIGLLFFSCILLHSASDV